MAAPFNFGMARSSKTTSGLSSNGFLDGIDTIDCFTANVQIGTSLYQITNDAANSITIIDDQDVLGRGHTRLDCIR